MSKVLILGAGASYGHGYDPRSAPRTRPPTSSGFFNHPLVKGMIEEYADLLDYLAQHLELDSTALAAADIETVVGRIEPVWRLGVLEPPAPREFRFDDSFEVVTPLELLQAFISDLVYESTDWLRSANCPLHERLVRHWLERGDAVISFNYDLIIDAALRRNSEWRETTGYGWNDANDSRPWGLDITPEPYEPPFVQLLKLHGSLNFRRTTRTRALPQSPLSGLPEAASTDMTPLR